MVGSVGKTDEGGEKRRTAKILFTSGNVIRITETDEQRIIGRSDIVRSTPANKAKYVSRKHCRIFRIGRKFYIQDGNGEKNSLNGTIVNGIKLLKNEKRLLRHNDIISLGGVVKLKFKYERLK
jgi:pSer/pThr/pTyr-binding forkhead associated (FHA) protein